MELIINIDNIKDAQKKEWLLSTLRLMGIGFKTMDKNQTLEEYNQELEISNAEVEKGEYITATDLKAEIKKW